MSPSTSPVARWAELVRFTLSTYVTRPEAVVVTPCEDERGAPLLVIEVDERDRGQVIGKAGKNLQALERALRLGADLSADLSAASGTAPRLELRG
ncbi:MAG: KH domain-containing protein [Deltaproteobacteria bacterium]|nr:KH domain-containing protein [Deltaproteobacteria bacterium]